MGILLFFGKYGVCKISTSPQQNGAGPIMHGRQEEKMSDPVLANSPEIVNVEHFSRTAKYCGAF
jgi:hypothetical protein